jgi:integrase
MRDVASILLDCALRPEECYRQEWEQIRGGAMHIPFGKTENARRSIPLTNRVAALLDARKATSTSRWVFVPPPRAATSSSHHLKKPHAKACKIAGIDFLRPTPSATHA